MNVQLALTTKGHEQKKQLQIIATWIVQPPGTSQISLQFLQTSSSKHGASANRNPFLSNSLSLYFFSCYHSTIEYIYLYLDFISFTIHQHVTSRVLETGPAYI